MPVKTTAQPATDKQLAFVTKLANERDYPVAGATLTEATILERVFDVLCQKPVAKHEASACIDYLLKRPIKSPLSDLPLSKYALEVGGVLRFYEIVERKGGARYLNGLVGSPGDFARRKLSYPEQIKVTAVIKSDPLAAAKRFGEKFTCCAKCAAPLTDPESIANKIGPVCIKSF